MHLAGFALLSLVVSTASAAPRFDEFGATIDRRAAQQLTESACAIDVELRGGLALIEERHTLANPRTAQQALGALYEGAVPLEGAVTGFAVRTGKTTTQGVVIAGQPDSDVVSVDAPVDPALLIGREGSYLAIVQPIQPGTDTTLIVRWSTPVEVRGGALGVKLPGTAGPCAGTLRASAGPGASVAKLLVDGRTAEGTRARGTFMLSSSGARVGAELAFARDQPVVWTQTQQLSRGAATLVTVAAPLQTRADLGHRRVLFVVDGSRSMQLVGTAAVREAVSKVVAALPANTPVEAIIFDRKPKRVLGAFSPASATSLGAIEKAISLHVPTNGSDLVAAFSLAHQAIADGQRDATLVVVISDGVLGDIPGQALLGALDAKTSTVDVLAIAIDPAQTRAPDIAALHAPVSVLGGSMVEVELARLDEALQSVSEWLRPAWHDVSLGDNHTLPVLRAGSGFVYSAVDTKPLQPTLALRSGTARLAIRARPAPPAPIAQVALRAALADDAKHPFAGGTTSFAVLASSKDQLTTARTQLARAGGKYMRSISIPDPEELFPIVVPIGSSLGASAIDKMTLTRLFREQLQPKAYACYQRALGTNTKLAGTVRFTFVLGRGEVTRVDLFGLGDATLDACLLDAAYALPVPFPDFTINIDDQTIANYPLTLQVNERKPVVIAGDADSSSPIDVDAIEGSIPSPARRPIKVDARTPLGTMRPSK